MLVFLCGTPTWRPENSEYLNLTNIHLPKHFSQYDTLTTKLAKKNEISVYFSTNVIAVFLSRTAITMKFKMRWFPKEGRYKAGNL